MALSVSGFPEPSRHNPGSNDVLTGDNANVQDGFGKAGLIASPRLRGLFSGTSSQPGANKRTETKNATTGKQDTEAVGGLGIVVGASDPSQSAFTTAPATTPPTTPLSFSTTSFEPLSQEEYELELQLPTMAATAPLDTPKLPSTSKRPGLPPVPRQNPAPSRTGPSLSRLEVTNAWARSPPTLYQPKPLPPSVIVHEWSGVGGSKGGNNISGEASSSSANQPQQQSRPLPSVPGNGARGPGASSSKAVANANSNAVAGPSKHANAIPEAADSSSFSSNSGHVNAAASSSKIQTEAGAGPSEFHGALASPMNLSSAPSTNALISSSPPASKLILNHTVSSSHLQRMHKGTNSVSMRYQPLVAEVSESSSNTVTASNITITPEPANVTNATTSTDTSGPINTSVQSQSSNLALISSPVRPLPRIPPTGSSISPSNPNSASTTVTATASTSTVNTNASSSSTSSSNSGADAGSSTATTTDSSKASASRSNMKRPKTTPGPITGLVLPSINSGVNVNPSGSSSSKSGTPGSTTISTGSSVNSGSSSASPGPTNPSTSFASQFSRSPFDNITASWASRASELSGFHHSTHNHSLNSHHLSNPNQNYNHKSYGYAYRANSPPLPVGGTSKPKLLPPRARSHSRPRGRDTSLESFYVNSASTSKPPSRVSSPVNAGGFNINHFGTSSPTIPFGPSPAGRIASPTGARSPRSLPSPTLGGARPLPSKSTTGKPLHIHTSTPILAFGATSGTGVGTKNMNGNWIVSPTAGGGGKRSQPPSPPAGPVTKPRTRPSPMSSPTIHAPVAASRILPKILVDPVISTVSATATTAHSTSASTSDAARLTVSTSGKAKENILDISHSNHKNDKNVETQSIDSGMHNHPIESFTDNESAIIQDPSQSVSSPTSESPIEVFMDDQDFSTLSRSPSPIRYARPDSAGILNDSEEEITYAANDGYVSSSTSGGSSRDSSPNPGGRRRKRNQQLRSYRNSYRPRSGRSSPPYIPYNSTKSSSPSNQGQGQSQSQSQASIGESGNGEIGRTKSSKDKKKKARSYFGGGSTLSTPGTRTSSPERKSRSRQPRRLAEAVSSALEEVGIRGRGASTSPKRKVKASASLGSGLVIGTEQHSTPATSSSVGHGYAAYEDTEVLDISLPPLSKRDTSGTIETGSSVSISGGSSARSSAKVAWANMAGNGSSRNKSELGDQNSNASGSATHLNDSTEVFGRASAMQPHRRVDSFGRASNSNRVQLYLQDDEVDQDGKPMFSRIETTVTSTVSVTRPPSSSVSTPFSGFSITGKSKKKRAMSVTTPHAMGDDASPAVIIHKTYQGHDGYMQEMQDNVGWVDITNGQLIGNDYEGSSRLLVEEGEMVVVTTKRVMRGVDGDGDIWEQEQETGVAEIIPHLRTLKAK